MRLRWTDAYGPSDFVGPRARAGAFDQLPACVPRLPEEEEAEAADRRLGRARVRNANANARGENRPGVTLTGTDQAGRNWEATIFGPSSDPGGQGFEQQTGDRALIDLAGRQPHSECSGLRAYQRALDAHYRR